MIYNDVFIERLARRGVIDPYNPTNLQPASYDVTLSNVFRTMRGGVYSQTVDPFDQETLDVLTERTEVDECYFINPFDFVLAGTVERLRVPDDVVCRIEGRSSLGRLGLAVHITAGYIDPGFEGNVTLECFNCSPHTIKLTPGMRIAQIGFIQMVARARKPYSGRYQNDSEAVPSRYGK